MNKERLLALADALETRIPKERFHLGGWRLVRDEDAVDTEDPSEEIVLRGVRMTEWDRVSDDQLMNDCGTAGCAVGWACALPEFQAEGLRWEKNGPSYGDNDSWDAVSSFFGITHLQFSPLFRSDYYDTREVTDPLAVAARIRQFVFEPGSIT